MKKQNAISNLSDTALHDSVVECADQEKQATLHLLDHLAEVDRRRLYALYGYASLWAYVCKELNYSESQAYERVAAMRLMTKAPEARTELENGNLTLTSAAKLSSHVRRERLSPSKTMDLLPQIQNKSVRETETILLNHQQELHPEKGVTRPDQIKAITNEITRITIDCDQELIKLLEQVKSMAGNPASQPKEIFKIALKEFVKRRMPKEPKPQIEKESSAPSLGSIQVTPHKTKTTISRFMANKTRILVKTRGEYQCEFISPLTHKQCGHKANLEIDHVVPHAKGGSNQPENLRLLCKAHNLHYAIQEFGLEKINSHLGRSK